MSKLTQDEVVRTFIGLINSTIEGELGIWDCSPDGFQAMRSELYSLASHFKVELPEERLRDEETGELSTD